MMARFEAVWYSEKHKPVIQVVLDLTLNSATCRLVFGEKTFKPSEPQCPLSLKWMYFLSFGLFVLLVPSPG